MSSSACPTVSCWSSSVRTASRCSVSPRCVSPRKNPKLFYFPRISLSNVHVGEEKCLWILLDRIRCENFNLYCTKITFIYVFKSACVTTCWEKGKTFPRADMSGPLQVYKACTDWVRWDMESRAQYLHALLNAVHIYALPPKFLKNQLLSCPILSKVNPPTQVFQILTHFPDTLHRFLLICPAFVLVCVFWVFFFKTAGQFL